MSTRLREFDRAAVGAARAVRRLAPGGDQLDEARDQQGGRTSDRIARLIEEVGADRPSASRELGLAAVATWQSLARRRDVGRNGAAVTILFTDLVDFSSWALLVGDDTVLRLLRKVGRVCETAASRYRGTVVKSLGDGLMVAFANPTAAIEAGCEMCTAVSAIDIDGYRPQLRAGLHTGHPRRVGKDYIGVDVNIAARVSAAAAGGQVLASDAALAEVDRERYRLRRKRGFRAKGAPTDIEVFSVTPLS
ncbi:adenylate/guanylate cyclase domain-containing protein [Pseudonocardia spinosispora]|uniref:adenylate/guanylate cyclase domain-containing protein n=1 Tax=Pseudonocardia spinosispora TaxID=103441 RepID=UPI000A017298|nr:adenylate/guanylate cyclase domain-containing protein [Pseudonocardia spinosispora]